MQSQNSTPGDKHYIPTVLTGACADHLFDTVMRIVGVPDDLVSLHIHDETAYMVVEDKSVLSFLKLSYPELEEFMSFENASNMVP